MTVHDGRAVASFDANCRAWFLKKVSSCRNNCPGNRFRPEYPGTGRIKLVERKEEPAYSMIAGIKSYAEV
jgi:hypothetical protein